MGMSLRAKLTLPFSFPSLIWKLLIQEEVVIGDLRDIDADAARHIEHLSVYLDPTQDSQAMEAEFNAKYCNDLALTFTLMGNDGIVDELIPNGCATMVTFKNLSRYCDALLTRHLHQFDDGIHAMTKGLNGVVPLHALYLFSWQDLEVLVAGQAVFNIPLWKANTETVSTLSPLVLELFWKVMESLTSKEHEGFVRFAWGRSRLPSCAEEFVVKMKLGPTGDREAKLPLAHVSSLCMY